MTSEVEALMSAMDFTSADLEANRRGDLSPAQAAMLNRNRRRQIAIAMTLFPLLVIAATILLYLGQINNNAILGGAGALMILLNALLVGIIGRSYMRLSQDLQAGNVDKLTGEVERVLQRGRQSDTYLLRINGDNLQVSQDIFRSFRHQALYRIYRANHSGLLLSAEPLG